MVALLLACARAPSDADVAAATLTAEDAGEVRAYTEGKDRWLGATLPIRSLTSLDAYAEGDTVFLSGLSHQLVPSALAEWFPQLFVVVLESTDLRTWSAHAWPVDAPGHSLIDPALVLGPTGRELWFVQVDGTGDPAQGSRPSQVVRTHWTGSGFGRAEVMVEGKGLVDPSPVYQGEAWEVFLTRDHHEVVATSGAGLVSVVAGLTVPHVRREGDTVLLTAQRVEAGRAQAVELRRTDGGGWSAPIPIELADGGVCSSPSSARTGATRVLFCAEERGR